MTNYFFKSGDKNIIITRLKEFFNSLPYLKSKNNRTMIFDSGLQASIAEFQVYHRLKTQDGSLNEETYAQLGTVMLDVQIDILSTGHPDLKKLLYGVGLIDPCANWDAVAPVIPKDKFVGWGDNYPKTPKNCFSYCQKQLSDVGHSLKSPGWGTASAVNTDVYQLYLTENRAGMSAGYQAKQFTQGVLYIKKALASKTPVMVGVDAHADLKFNAKTKKYEVHHDNADHVTDHFVVIVGMGSDPAGKYFSFYDNATGDIDAGTSDKNRLYCDCANFSLIGQGDNTYGRAGYGQYTVTQIRETK